MKKLISLFVILCLLFSCALAEELPDETAETVSASPMSVAEKGDGFVTLAFEGNPTTGYQWTAALIGGNSVAIDEAESTYVPNDAPAGMAGVGGVYSFKLNLLAAGDSVLRFSYARSWETEAIEESIVLVTVDESLSATVQDITETGVQNALVLEVKADEHSLVLFTMEADRKEYSFVDDLKLPEQNEQITVFLNGEGKGIAWENLPARLGIEPVSKLPAYVYSGDDLIEEAIAYETLQLSNGLALDLSVSIPAPTILKLEKPDETHATVYGNFMKYTYTVIGNVLLTTSGSSNPGCMELVCEDGKWTVTNAMIAEEDEDLKAILANNKMNDKELEIAFANAELVDTVRLHFVSQYVKDNQLPIVAYQDPYWAPIPLEEN